MALEDKRLLLSPKLRKRLLVREVLSIRHATFKTHNLRPLL